MAIGCLVVAGLVALALLSFFVMMGTLAQTPMGFLTIFLAPLLAAAVPLAVVPALAGYGILHGHAWGRWLGYGAAGLVLLSSLTGVAAMIGAEAAAPGYAWLFLQAGAAVAAILALSTPEARAFFEAGPARRREAAAPPAERRSGSRGLLGLGMVLGMFVLATVVALPLQSLRTDSDGASLVPDSLTAAALGVGMLGLGVYLQSREGAEPRVSRILGTLGAALALTTLLIGASRELSRSVVRDGRAEATGLLTLAQVMLLGWTIVLLVALARAADAEKAATRWGGATLAAGGLAALLHAGYVLNEAEPLAAAAQARAHYNTPGLGLVALLVAVALAAVALRRRR